MKLPAIASVLMLAVFYAAISAPLWVWLSGGLFLGVCLGAAWYVGKFL